MANDKAESQQVEQRQWFAFYKPTQGKKTRLGTAIGGTVLALWGADWVFGLLAGSSNTPSGRSLQVGLPLLWLAIWGAVLYWVAGRNARTVDFFVAVEGEMKKVNWSTRQEVIGATKVVVFFVALLTLLLFVIDLFFVSVFSLLGVTQVSGVLQIIWEWLHRK